MLEEKRIISQFDWLRFTLLNSFPVGFIYWRELHRTVIQQVCPNELELSAISDIRCSEKEFLNSF